MKTAKNYETRPTAELVPYAKNARTHSKAQVDQIAESIKRFGFTNPVLIDGSGGIIAGHGRVLAAKKLKMDSVPTLTIDHLTDDEKRAYVLADNKLALNGGWDEAMLAEELKALGAAQFDTSVIGFSTDELNSILGIEKKGKTDVDDVPEVPATPHSKLGDIWIMGDHRVMCGDSTSAAEMNILMQGQLADLVFTDPPYNVDYGNTAKDKMRGTNRTIMNDNLGEGFGKFLYDTCVNMLAVCKGAIYVCMSSSELHTLHNAFVGAGGKWSTFIIWAKNTFTLGRADYQRQYEPILYGWKQGTDHYFCGARDQGDVWFVNKPVRNELHPTMKPVELVERAINNSSKTRDIVLDCFGGSGSTMMACEKTGRAARLMELDPKYVDVIVRRWQDYTGQKAIHAETGKAFGE